MYNKRRKTEKGFMPFAILKGDKIMLFTDGKDRFYERIMQEIPCYGSNCDLQKKKRKRKRNKNKCNNNQSRFKYRYEDLSCEFCMKADKETCSHTICPYIMENLDNLVCDNDFLNAVSNATNCQTPHKFTLLMLQKNLKTT